LSKIQSTIFFFSIKTFAIEMKEEGRAAMSVVALCLLLLLSATHADVLLPEQHAALMLIFNATGTDARTPEPKPAKRTERLRTYDLWCDPQAAPSRNRRVSDLTHRKTASRLNRVSTVKPAR
jgi:hypothetical protein